MNSQSYNQEFYEGLKRNNAESANYLAKYLVNTFKFSSVIDIGCGNGDLLSAFSEMGVKKLAGVEGNQNSLPPKMPFPISIANLEQPIAFSEKYDLAVCLEVAEHLEDRFAENLILTLTNASDLIVFSAAIPGQGGTNHVNEQPPIYWALKFLKNGFTLMLDPRDDIWSEPNIAPYYRQNILVYKKSLESYPVFIQPKFRQHPEIFLSPIRKCERFIFRLIRKLLSIVKLI